MSKTITYETTVITVEKVKEICFKAVEENEYVCFSSSNESYVIIKPNEEDLDTLIAGLENCEVGVHDKSLNLDFVYVERGRDWNFFKTLMNAL